MCFDRLLPRYLDEERIKQWASIQQKLKHTLTHGHWAEVRVGAELGKLGLDPHLEAGDEISVKF